MQTIYFTKMEPPGRKIVVRPLLLLRLLSNCSTMLVVNFSLVNRGGGTLKIFDRAVFFNDNLL